jgi:hypothetical protein
MGITFKLSVRLEYACWQRGEEQVLMDEDNNNNTSDASPQPEKAGRCGDTPLADDVADNNSPLVSDHGENY